MMRTTNAKRFQRALAGALLCLAGAALLAAPASADGRHPDDVNWYGGFGPSGETGPDGPIFCSVLFEGRLVVGGEFLNAGGETVNRVAAWDGAGWAPLGAGFDDTVLALAAHDDQLYAGGEFLNAEGALVNYLAVWDGESWDDVDQGVDGPIYALISFDGYLWLGGDFNSTIADSYAACNVFRWDDGVWYGAGLTGNCQVGAVLDFAVYQTAGADPILAAGGTFSTMGGNACAGVAWWQGDNWLPISGGVDGSVFDLIAYGDRLLAAGDFDLVDGTPIHNLAAWDGAAWAALDADEPDDAVRALHLDGATLYVGGDFLNLGAGAAERVAAFDGADWTALSTQCEDAVREIAMLEGTLIVGGDFHTGDGSAVDYIGALAEQVWTPLAPAGFGADDTVYDVCDYGGELVICGTFDNVGGAAIPYLAAWDGAAWHDIGGTVDGPVYGLCAWDGKLVVGGDFANVGSVPAARIAAWDGAAWSALGTGCSAFVWDMIEHGGDLVACGQFTTAGGVTARRIAGWNGSAWYAFDEGFNDTCYGLLSHEGTLYATGAFQYTGMGGLLRYVASWDGAAWAMLGGGITSTGYVAGYDLAAYEGEVYIAGRFTQIEGHATNGFAKWDGAEWVTYGVGAWGFGYTGYCNSLCIYRDRLAVGGNFDELWQVESGDVAFWDGEEVWALGSAFPAGLANQVNSMHAFDGSLFLGGSFLEVGGRPSINLARWTDDWVPVLLNGFHLARVPGGVRLDWEIAAGSSDLALRLLRAGPGSETEIPFAEQTPGIFRAMDDSPEILLGGLFTYSLFGREGGEDWLLLRSESVRVEGQSAPPRFAGVFPNPFNPRATLRLIVSEAGPARLSVYDVAGRRIRVLHAGELGPGVHDFHWRGDDGEGAAVSSGVYLALLETAGGREARRIVLLR
ncbi:MAG: T9SS type A sorting domain-containing protein [Candidatus Krumholzibacteriota bacterium]|nr:T9SS type A sorting domain-containing protein [Candidatus Krumholzibacteriota bacterium]